MNIPYFYIIRHISSGKMYAGSRYAKNCTPDEFMKFGGYCTSSNIVNDIIKKEGLDSFEILRIDTYCDDLHPYDYECLFLHTLNCAKSNDWLNCHNNSGISFGNDKYINLLIELYGVDNISKMPEIKSQKKETMLKNYGTYKIYELPNVLSNIKQKNQSEYGVDFYVETDEFKQKCKTTLMENYGVEHNSQIPEVKQSKINKSLENYGTEYPQQSEVIKNKIKNTYKQRYGESDWNKIPELKEKRRQSYMQTCKNRKEVTCCYCGKVGKDSPPMKKFHFENCKLKRRCP